MDDKVPYEIQPLLIEIVRKAQEDDHITPEEAELINRIQNDIVALEQEIAKAVKEGMDEQAGDIYKNGSARVLENAKRIALRDGIISEDEQRIIDKLIEKIQEYEINL